MSALCQHQNAVRGDYRGSLAGAPSIERATPFLIAVVARREDELTLKCYVRTDERRGEFRPERSNPAHQPIQGDFEKESFEIVGVAVGALIGDGFNGPERENWGA